MSPLPHHLAAVADQIKRALAQHQAFEFTAVGDDEIKAGAAIAALESLGKSIGAELDATARFVFLARAGL